MKTYKISDIAIEISNRIDHPYENGYEKFVGLEHYISGEMLITNYGKTDNLSSSVKEFKKNDILIARRNVYLKRAGIVLFDGVTSGDSIVLRANNKQMEKILPFVLNSEMFWDYADKHADGSMSKRLSPKMLLEYEFELPEEEKLEDYSKLLWSLFDTKIAYKRLLEKSDELVKARFVEMFGDINETSKWERKQWNDVLRIQNGKDYKHILVEDGGYPVYGTGGEMARASEYLCPENTIIVGRKGTINNPLLVKEKFWNVDTAFGVIPGDELHYQYLYNFCRMFDFEKLNKAAVLPSTTKGDLLKIEMNVPPLKLQKQFASYVEQIDKSKFVIQKSLESVEKLMKSIINKEFDD